MTADVEISDKQSAGCVEQSAVGEERSGDVDTPSLKDSTNYSNGRHSVGKRARIEHPETLVKSFNVPFSLECKGFESAIAKGVRVDAEKKLVGNYYEKKDSTSYSHGRHSVGKRARIEHPEALVKSFNVPFRLECKGCESAIAKGVRVNAEKKLVGNYYEKKIWSFTFECVYCGRKIVMERISKDWKYEVMKGARRKSARHQGRGEPVHRRHFQSELEQQPKYSGWGVFPSTDLKNQFPFTPLYGLVNVKSQR